MNMQLSIACMAFLNRSVSIGAAVSVAQRVCSPQGVSTAERF